MTEKGHFVWFELMTRNPDGALDFYGKVAGWGSTPWNSGSTPYTILTRTAEDNTGVGGMMKMEEPDFPPELPSHFMGYISTDDADGTAERIKELGGKIHHGPADIPEVGRFAVAEDPQGAFFSILQMAQSGEENTPQPGDFSWCELMAADYATAYDFYNTLFGWQTDTDMDMGGGMIYRIFRPSDGTRSVGGIFTKPDDVPSPPMWIYYIHVADLDASLAAVRENGGQVVYGPQEVPGGDRIAQCIDPEGTFFALHTSGTAEAAE